MTRIKLCGLARTDEIKLVNTLDVEYVGFVFVPSSKRYITKEKAKKLRELLTPQVQTVGVFVNAPIEMIISLYEQGIITIAQLHGTEDEQYIEALRKYGNIPIIKAYRIDTKEDIQLANCSSAEHVLLDSGAGGTGTVFDWSLLQLMEREYFLAGGLSVGNVKEAIHILHPFAVDVSSGIETNGSKDLDKMKEFVNQVREVE